MPGHASSPHPHLHPEQTIAEQLEHTLRSKRAFLKDVAYGEGFSFHLGQTRQTHLELYEAPAVTRVTSGDSQASLHRFDGVEVGEAHVIFRKHGDTGEMALTVKADGAFRLTSLPRESVEGLVSPAVDANTVESQLARETTVSEPYTPSEAVSLPSPEQEGESATREEKDRLTLMGRVGKEPVFRKTRNGVLVARFPVAVREEDASTTWHQVLAFNERARKLEGAVSKGQVVEVIGYPHERQSKTRDGKIKTVREVYAAVVKPR